MPFAQDIQKIRTIIKNARTRSPGETGKTFNRAEGAFLDILVSDPMQETTKLMKALKDTLQEYNPPQGGQSNLKRLLGYIEACVFYIENPEISPDAYRGMEQSQQVKFWMYWPKELNELRDLATSELPAPVSAPSTILEAAELTTHAQQHQTAALTPPEPKTLVIDNSQLQGTIKMPPEYETKRAEYETKRAEIWAIITAPKELTSFDITHDDGIKAIKEYLDGLSNQVKYLETFRDGLLKKQPPLKIIRLKIIRLNYIHNTYGAY